MRRALLGFFALALLAACATPAAPAGGGGVELRLERGPCFGACPTYSVTISGDGKVAFEGQRFVRATGAHQAQVAPADVARLVERFRAAGFHNLRDEYRARVTDLPTYTLTLTEGGRTKTIVDYGGDMIGMPPVVRELEDAIDDLAGTARWVGGDGE